MAEGVPRLGLAGIDKSFAGVRALRDVSLTVRAGEVHALVGENGAGKSTLIKIITGVLAPDAGTVAVDGRPVAAMTPSAARALGIAAIYQHPALFPHLTVAENLALALEPTSGWRLVNRSARRTRAAALLAELGAGIDPDRPASTLSMPEQQLVEIAKAVGSSARLILMDEPTASLSARETTRLFETVQRLAGRGVSIVYISHRLAEVFALADRVTILRDGAVVATRQRADLSPDDAIRLMVGRTVMPASARKHAHGDVALELDGVTSRATGVHDISLRVRHGEVVALAGLVGAGRTELAEVIAGLGPRDSGTIAVDRRRVAGQSPHEAIAAGIGYLPEDRLHHGVIAEMSVAANTSLASLGAVSRTGFIDRALETRLAKRYVERFQIKTTGIDSPVGDLSGGNQQKVALARWLATAPKVLVVDEPTQGVDVGSKAEIHAALGDLAAAGLAILLISSELTEVLAMSDRILVMRGGRIVGELSRHEATEERILALALPGESPSSPLGADA